MVQRFHSAENVTALRDEYQQLATKELARSLSPEEAARLETAAGQLSDLEMQSETSRVWEEQTARINVLLQELKGALQAFPDKK